MKSEVLTKFIGHDLVCNYSEIKFKTIKHYPDKIEKKIIPQNICSIIALVD